MAEFMELLYGPPGSGKSRSVITLIQKMHRETGKIARVYVADGSKGMYLNSGLVQKGVVEIMQFDDRDYPFTTCQQITEGFWPLTPNDPTSKMIRLTPEQVLKTGMWIFEGVATMGNYMMGTKKGGLAQRAAEGEVIGQEGNIAIKDDGEHKYGGNPGAHFGFGQRHLLANILRSRNFPGTVIWTTHEKVSDGEKGGAFAKGASAEKTKVSEKAFGPEAIGQALTPVLSREFGNTLHFVTATKKVQDGTDAATGKTNYKEQTEYRIYTRNHYDPDGIVGLMYTAVNRAMYPEKVKDYYTSPISDPGQGILEFYSDLQKGNDNGQ